MQQQAFPGLAPPPQRIPNVPGIPGPPVGGMHHNTNMQMNANLGMGLNPAALRPTQMGPTQPEKELMALLDAGTDHMLQLRGELVNFSKFLSKGIPRGDQSLKFAEQITNSVNQISVLYDKVESKAKSYPTTLPQTPCIELMSRFMQESSLDINYAQFLENVWQLALTQETYNQTYHYMFEFLRAVKRKNSIYAERIMYSGQADLHRTFIQMFKMAAQDARKRGWDVRQSEHSAISSVFELQYYGLVDIGSVRDAKQHPACLKMAMLINSGSFEFVQFIAPNEDWKYLDYYQYKDDNGIVIKGRKIDPFEPSRYQVYQRMTTTLNIHVIHNFNNQFLCEPKPLTFNKQLGYFAMFSNVFISKCRYCHKILRNFMPPLPLLVSAKEYCHEKCMP
ncbi:hypothetical protein L596_016711 [Steinernema carpocapsae]|uniref:Mediator of RNA polymerase II transcription subunit 27 n=1 Tax=Steinernema carpocapsae TaxID=34508 RepID=A0A4U5NIU9_STECR|nr:hypothetical protein L596_016711 [Steinernema carpocapsae]